MGFLLCGRGRALLLREREGAGVHPYLPVRQTANRIICHRRLRIQQQWPPSRREGFSLSESNLANHSIRHVEANSVLRTLRRAMPHTGPADQRGTGLHRNECPGRNRFISLHQHPKAADLDRARRENAIALTICPAQTNLPLDGGARMQTFAGALLRTRISLLRTGLR